MRRNTIRVFVALFFCFAVCQSFGQTTKNAHPDFSGTWFPTDLETDNKIPGFNLKIEKGKMVEVACSESTLHIVTKKEYGDKYAIEREETYYTDKRGETNAFIINGRSINVATTTQWEGKKIVITNVVDKNKNEWEISSDGSKLTQKTHIKTNYDKFFIALIFMKLPTALP